MGVFKVRFPFYMQHDKMDCGPTCLKMIAKFYGKELDLEHLRSISYLNKDGVSLYNLSEGAEAIGFRSLMVQVSYEKLLQDCPMPSVLHWNDSHFVVLIGVKKNQGSLFKSKETTLLIADPAHNIIEIDEATFLKSWLKSGTEKGVALVLSPTQEFYEEKTEESVENPKKKKKWVFLASYLKPYQRYILQLFIGLLMGNAIALMFPFLTQTLVDYGVGYKNHSLVILILASQLLLFLGEIGINLVRSWIILHMNMRISISIMVDFLAKLMKLPISFFDIKSTGDINQRIHDHERIESFLTGVSLTTFFSAINIVIFTAILYFYSLQIFLIFLVLSGVSIAWIFLFLAKRRKLDYKLFQGMRENQDSIFEIINGMQEIKLNQSELSKRWEWEHIQIRLFKLNIKSLSLAQYQNTGFHFINQLKNILISYIAAVETIQGTMTLGMMLSVSYIIGQTNGPIQQLIEFFRASQDAKISLERLQEIQEQKNEQEPANHLLDLGHSDALINKDLHLENVSFRYGGPQSPLVLQNIDLHIPKGKITAIVGASGSGKTTLLKLLLKFYVPTEGKIILDHHPLEVIDNRQWRKHCGTVMQDGYIFNDNIAQNIAIDGADIDMERLLYAAKVANIDEFVDRLPLGYSTRLSSGGSGVSGGQRQRLLIARAVYKNPHYIFFDEATSALDANNEKVILDNLKEFFQGKTVVVIAHRLSTVKNADQIVVLDQGKITEVGDHQSLIERRGDYFNLIKNQLELGN
ncbi:MAG TPA: ABC transporter ATP-binding protein [Microscillaceae bacterium]|nr:ABC transporter ATP-binding protein [Microscillaceae bacterium]